MEGENAKVVLPGFTATTGIPVDRQVLAWTAAHEKLLTAYAGGSLPDVMMLAKGWIGEFRMIGAIQPLPRAETGLLRDVFAPQDLRIGTEDLGVPWTLDVAVQYYRRDLLARAGYAAPPVEGWDAWKTMLRRVARVQGPDRYAILMQLNWPDHLLRIADQQAEPLRDRLSRGNFRSPGFRAALAFYKSLFDEGLAPRVTSIEASDPAGDLARGWVAVHGSGSWVRAELLRPERHLIEPALWGTAPMPGPAGSGGAHNTVAGAVLCVSSTAADPARAWSLVRYLCESRTQLALNLVAGTLPSRPSAWDAARIARDPVMRTFRQALERPAPARYLLEWDQIAAAMQQIAEQMVRGRLSVDEAATEMDRRADAILAKRRWLLDRGRIA